MKTVEWDILNPDQLINLESNTRGEQALFNLGLRKRGEQALII